MGIELIIAGLSAITGVVGGIAQASAASSAARQQREANATQSAQNQVEGTQSRRERIREARIRRAQMIAASETTGTSNSSGLIGGTGALNTNLGGLVSASSGASAANNGINRNMQRAADYTARGNTIGAWTNTIQQGFGGFQSIFDQK